MFRIIRLWRPDKFYGIYQHHFLSDFQFEGIKYPCLLPNIEIGK